MKIINRKLKTVNVIRDKEHSDKYKTIEMPAAALAALLYQRPDKETRLWTQHEVQTWISMRSSS
jgi:hypothetical protein